MEILDDIKRFFGLAVDNSEANGAGCARGGSESLRFLNGMQAICNALPGGEVFVDMDNGEMTVRVTWKAQKGEVAERQTFSLNGGDTVTIYRNDGGGGQDDDRERTKKNLSPVRRLSLFLRSRYAFRYNLLTEQAECAKTVGDGGEAIDESHLIYMPADQRTLNGISLAAMDYGICCWDRDVRRYVESDRVEAYHPFQRYFDTLTEWDGQDRVTPLAERVSNSSLWIDTFHRWMLATAAQWMGLDGSGRANSVAPVIISRRQGMGKSTFCRTLMPPELRRYFTESFDLNTQSQAEAKLATFGLVNIDEFDRLPTTKMPLLKNLMQMERLNIRKAYRRTAEPLRRIASFIATSNRRDLLTDATGSRRFFCVETDSPIDCSPIDHAQLYAQLKAELLRGERHWFTKEEEAAIEANNRPYYRASVAEEVFRSCFDAADAPGDGARLMTAAEIYAELRRRHPAAMRDVSCASLSRLLPAIATRVHTKYCNGYFVKARR